MNLPDEEQCLRLFKEYKVPGNILNHCQQVRKVAGFLCRELNKKGVSLNLELVEKAALLHDSFKTVSIERLDNRFSEEEKKAWELLRKKYPGMNEAEVSYLILKPDYPELALLIKDFANHQKISQGWEEKILLYADTRVLKNEIVPLKKRMTYIKKVYSLKIPNFDSFHEKIKDYEEEIMKKIGLAPDKLAEAINGC